MNREYHKWHSPTLSKSMELLVFGTGGKRVIVFPTRTGRFFDYENWGLVEALKDKIENKQLQLFCLDSVDEESFYCQKKSPKDRMRRHLQFEQYLLQEVLPFTYSKNLCHELVAHGCSLGAYHALNLALRYPFAFTKIVALSGRFDLTYEIGDFPDLFDGYMDDMVYQCMPSRFIPNLKDTFILDQISRLDITIAVGEEDPFLQNNKALSASLIKKNVPHNLYIWSGRSHKPVYWAEMTRLYF